VAIGDIYLLNVRLGLRVERAVEVGLVCLEVSWATNGVSLVIGVDAASGKDGDVDALQEAAVCEVEGTDDIVSDGLLLVVLAPVDIWSARRSSSVEDVGGLDLLQFGEDSLSVLHTDGGGVDLLSCSIVSCDPELIWSVGKAHTLGLEESLQVARNPTFTTPDEENRFSSHGRRDLVWKECVLVEFCGMMRI